MTPGGNSFSNVSVLKTQCLSCESWLTLTALTVILSLSLCLEEFSGQLTVRSRAVWVEWLAEDNDRFPHPLSKQAMVPASLPPPFLRSTCTSAWVHEAWPEQGLEGMRKRKINMDSLCCCRVNAKDYNNNIIIIQNLTKTNTAMCFFFLNAFARQIYWLSYRKQCLYV